MAEEKKQKSTFIQFVLFIIMSLAAFAAQFVIIQFGPKLLGLCGVDTEVKFKPWIFEEQTMAVFISFLVGNVVAKVLSYILNRKKTFGAVNNLVFSMTVYVIMCVALIIAETLVGEPLSNAYANLFKSNPGIAEWAPTFSMITYSVVDFLIVFLMEKFVIMNDNLFKSSKKNNDKIEENVVVEEEKAKEEVAAEEIKKEPIVEEVKEETIEEPVVEETLVEEDTTKEEQPEEVVEEKVEENVVAEDEEETKEEVAAEEVKEEPIVEEVKKPATKKAKKAPAKKEESKAEEVEAKEEQKEEEKENVEEPIIKVEEKQQEGTPAVKEEKKAKTAPAKKAAPAQKPMGTIEYDLRVDGYHFSIYANNKQLMFESQGFASLDSAEGGLETFRKALTTGVASVYQDKKKLWRFIINKRYVGECYKTRAQAEAAIESVKKFADLGKVVEYVENPEKVAAYNQAKKNFNKGEKVDWEKALAIPAKTSGKFTITGHEERGFFFALYANNGQLLYGSRYYATEDSCEDAINTFKKAAYLNNFFVDADKFGNYRFVLKGLGGANVYIGESYKTKDAAISSAESVRKFAATAKIVPFDPDADDE